MGHYVIVFIARVTADMLHLEYILRMSLYCATFSCASKGTGGNLGPQQNAFQTWMEPCQPGLVGLGSFLVISATAIIKP